MVKHIKYDGTVTSVFGLPNFGVQKLECGRSYLIILNLKGQVEEHLTIQFTFAFS